MDGNLIIPLFFGGSYFYSFGAKRHSEVKSLLPFPDLDDYLCKWEHMALRSTYNSEWVHFPHLWFSVVSQTSSTSPRDSSYRAAKKKKHSLHFFMFYFKICILKTSGFSPPHLTPSWRMSSRSSLCWKSISCSVKVAALSAKLKLIPPS